MRLVHPGLRRSSRVDSFDRPDPHRAGDGRACPADGQLRWAWPDAAPGLRLQVAPGPVQRDSGQAASGLAGPRRPGRAPRRHRRGRRLTGGADPRHWHGHAATAARRLTADPRAAVPDRGRRTRPPYQQNPYAPASPWAALYYYSQAEPGNSAAVARVRHGHRDIGAARDVLRADRAHHDRGLDRRRLLGRNGRRRSSAARPPGRRTWPAGGSGSASSGRARCSPWRPGSP